MSRVDRVAVVSRGEPTTPPPIAPARGPPSAVSDLDQTPAYDLATAEPVPDYDLDQTSTY